MRVVHVGGAYRALCTRCARAVRKVGHSPPPVGSFLSVGLPQGTIAIVYPCSINPPPSCVYVPLQTGTLRPVYGDTFSGCLPRGIIFCSHFSHPLLHSPSTLMLEIGCSTLTHSLVITGAVCALCTRCAKTPLGELPTSLIICRVIIRYTSCFARP